MANTITGKIWSLDTATGVVSTGPVNIFSIRVRFTTAGAGSLLITTTPREGSTAETLLDLKTTAATSAAAYVLDQQYLFGGQYFNGIQKTLSVNVDTIYVITGIPD